jgi:hypothetical protein
VAAAGTTRWCADKKSYIQQIATDGKLFEKPAAKFGDTPDEMATILASLMIAQHVCGLKTNDTPLNSLVTKHGFQLKAFMPDGTHASLVETKMRGAQEFLKQYGREKGCEGITDTVREFLPEVVLAE